MTSYHSPHPPLAAPPSPHPKKKMVETLQIVNELFPNFPSSIFWIMFSTWYHHYQTLLIINYFIYPLYKKWSFPLRISSVNVFKSAGKLRIWSRLLKKPLIKNFIFAQWFFHSSYILKSGYLLILHQYTQKRDDG